MGAREAKADASPRLLRVVLVSGHKMARAGMAQVVGSQPDMRLCGEFDTCHAMMAALANALPDAVVLEFDAGDGGVLDALGRCRAIAPRVAFVIVSHSRSPDLAERAIQAGARGYVYRNAGAEALIEALRSAARGGLHVCRCIASPLLQKTLCGKPGRDKGAQDLSCLSPREFQVFQLLGSGTDNRRIAEELGISIKTLNAHKENLKNKLDVDTSSALKTAAMLWQRRDGS